MKSVQDVIERTRRYFARHRIACVAGVSDAWPLVVSLGSPTKAELAHDMQAIAAGVDELLEWAQTAPVAVECERRRLGGAVRSFPARVVVATIDDAAVLCGKGALRDLQRARRRKDYYERCGAPELDASGMLHVLKATDGWEDTDYGILLEAARWFATHDASGLTPRQVPLAEFSTKWLDAGVRRKIIENILGRSLGLRSRPRMLEFAYLDEDHLGAGGRRFDSYTKGDSLALPYDPHAVVIVENKDTFLGFPSMSKGLCVFGSGWAGTAVLPSVSWMADVPCVYYWGDIDADGYEILDAYRAKGLAVKSIFMDMDAYRRYEAFGTSEATGTKPLALRTAKPLVHLNAEEREVYELVTSRDCLGHRRIEQERIPFADLLVLGLGIELATQ